jgi:D-glycero-D-manno-heptose 1,7-bisphosphate phosphatase
VTTPRPAVFLDRDGTLIEERHYPVRREDIVLLPGVGRALGRLGRAGWLRIVLTNQSAVARGLLTEEELSVLHEDLAAKLALAGGAIDALYYCPHLPDGRAMGYAHACHCRKPSPGLLELALADHAIDLGRSAFIGDAPRDLFPSVEGAGPRILVRTGHPLEDTGGADHVADALEQAVEWLLARSAPRG